MKKEVIFDFINNKEIISGDIRSQDVPITFDNKLFFTVNKLDKVNVSIINTINKKIVFVIYSKMIQVCFYLMNTN